MKDSLPSAVFSFSGVVLAGGKSSRMGTDKALLSVDGQRLWEKQYALLAEAGATERFLSVRADQTWPPADVQRVADTAPDLGPLAGIAAAFSAAGGSHLIVIAVDLPRISAAWFRILRDRCASEIGAVGQDEDGVFEPLAAIYPLALRTRAEAALKARALSLQTFLAQAIAAGFMRAVQIEAKRKKEFENWNSPADLSG